MEIVNASAVQKRLDDKHLNFMKVINELLENTFKGNVSIDYGDKTSKDNPGIIEWVIENKSILKDAGYTVTLVEANHNQFYGGGISISYSDMEVWHVKDAIINAHELVVKRKLMEEEMVTKFNQVVNEADKFPVELSKKDGRIFFEWLSQNANALGSHGYQVTGGAGKNSKIYIDIQEERDY